MICLRHCGACSQQPGSSASAYLKAKEQGFVPASLYSQWLFLRTLVQCWLLFLCSTKRTPQAFKCPKGGEHAGAQACYLSKPALEIIRQALALAMDIWSCASPAVLT